MAKRRRGRPRKPGARTKSGRLSRSYAGPARDNGTSELQRHRLALVNGSADPALSSSLAGIMLAHGILTPAQKAAADRYRRMRGALYGVPLPRNDHQAPPADPDRLAKLQRDFNQMVRRLTVEQKLALTDLALDLRPRWLRAQLLGAPVAPADARERVHLLEALDAIGP